MIDTDHEPRIGVEPTGLSKMTINNLDDLKTQCDGFLLNLAGQHPIAKFLVD
jgi:hypothetical protein